MTKQHYLNPSWRSASALCARYTLRLLRTSTSTGRALNVFCKQLQQPDPTCHGWSHPSKGWAAPVASSAPIWGTEGEHWPLLPFHPRVSLCCRECCYYFSPLVYSTFNCFAIKLSRWTDNADESDVQRINIICASPHLSSSAMGLTGFHHSAYPQQKTNFSKLLKTPPT